MQKLPAEEELDAIPAGLAVIDPAGRVVRSNTQWVQLMRATAGQQLLRQVVERAPGEPVLWGAGDDARLVIAGPVVATAAGNRRVVLVLDNREQQGLLDTIAGLSDLAVNDARSLRVDKAELERRVRDRTAELRASRHDTVLMLATASEAKDADTGAHVRRIRDYATLTALAMGWSDSAAADLGEAAMLHDVGKIHIPDAVLSKPGRLTTDERTLMQTHTTAGEQILGDNPFFRTARIIARSHHERPDGRGYPDHLGGDDIHPAARIVHVVDVFDALSSPRVYKPGWPRQEVIDALLAGRDTEFDRASVDAFLDALN